MSSPQEKIASFGYYLTKIDLPGSLRGQVDLRNWEEVDRTIHRETKPGGVIFQELCKYAEFSEIEFIISIRSSLINPDEDGIWHDDGSRILAFSLSLTSDPSAVAGGRLEIRKRSIESAATAVLPTPTYGEMIVFATGTQGYEHKINRVTQGERIIIAGWCT